MGVAIDNEANEYCPHCPAFCPTLDVDNDGNARCPECGGLMHPEDNHPDPETTLENRRMDPNPGLHKSNFYDIHSDR
jgi:hypothetical protein